MMRYCLIILLYFGGLMLGTAEPSRAEVAAGEYYQVTLKDAEDAVARALEQAGVAEHVAVTIIGSRNPVMFTHTKPLTLEVRTLDFSQGAGKWSANLFFKAGEDVLTATPVAGRFDEMIRVPVLNKRMHDSDIISAQDIEWLDMPAARVRKDTVLSEQALLGNSPRRTISPRRPMREMEVGKPMLVKKDETVQILYKTATVEITASGQALEDGAAGQSIRVRNNDSKMVVQAVVQQSGLVMVNPPRNPIEESGHGKQE